jgi:SnoaL-like domain
MPGSTDRFSSLERTRAEDIAHRCQIWSCQRITGLGYASRALPAKRDHDRLDSWLQRFARAWEERDPDGAAALFSERGSYRETPFDEPLRGAEAIRAYWSHLPPARSDIRFAYELLAVTEQWGMAHWHGSYTPVDRATPLELDGILLVSLDDDGRCEDFREWSNRRRVAVPPAAGRAAVRRGKHAVTQKRPATR